MSLPCPGRKSKKSAYAYWRCKDCGEIGIYTQLVYERDVYEVVGLGTLHAETNVGHRTVVTSEQHTELVYHYHEDIPDA